MSYVYKASYTADSMARAVSAVRRNTRSVRKAAAEYGVPRSKLMDQLKGSSLNGSSCGEVLVVTFQNNSNVQFHNCQL